MKLNTFMRSCEFIFESEQLDEAFNLKRMIASALLAGTIGIGGSSLFVYANRKVPVKADPYMTTLGQKIIKDLPPQILKKLGNPKDIIFTIGIPENGDPNAICQVAQGTKIVFVNPKYADKFKDEIFAYETISHETEHIAQDHYNSENIKKLKSLSSTDYEGMTSFDAADKLRALRANGDTMSNHSRESQATIAQNYVAFRQQIAKMKREGKSAKELEPYEKNFEIYAQYVNDIDAM